VRTKRFLERFGLDTLRDLPDLEALQDAGLLNSDMGEQGAAKTHDISSFDDESGVS
jgi:segregation and condensation protein B